MPISNAPVRRAIVISVLLAFALAVVTAPLAASAQSDGGAQQVSVTITLGGSLGVLAPAPSNLTLLSVVGGQYSIRQQEGVPVPGIQTLEQNATSRATVEEIVFVPGNSSVYTVEVNVTSREPTYALVTEGTVPPENLLRNVTGGSTFDLKIKITVAPSTSKSGGYSLLFGFTGLSLGQINLSTTDVLLVFTSLSIALMGLGLWRNRKLFGLGLLLLLGIGTILIGLLVAALLLALYVAGFVAVNSYFSLKTRKPRRETSGPS